MLTAEGILLDIKYIFLRILHIFYKSQKATPEEIYKVIMGDIYKRFLKSPICTNGILNVDGVYSNLQIDTQERADSVASLLSCDNYIKSVDVKEYNFSYVLRVWACRINDETIFGKNKNTECK